MLTRSTLVAAAALSLVAILPAGPARAQPRPEPAPAKPEPAQPAPAAQPPVEEPTATAAKFDIKDPLLEPMPPPARSLTGWRDVLSLINARSTELRVAVLEIERAKGVTREALGRALPQINATGSVGYDITRADATSTTTTTTNPPFPNPDPTQPPPLDTDTETASGPSTLRGWDARAALTIAQPILAPRVWHAIGTARRTEQAVKLTSDDQKRLVVAAVANAIVAVVTAERVSEVNRSGLRSALERLDLFQRKLKLGSGTLLDIVRAEQDATLARATLVSSNEALLQAREGLGLALGSSEAYGVPASISLNDIEASARATCSPATPDGRADVLAAKADLEISERAVTDVKLAYLPTAEVSTTFALSRSGSSDDATRTSESLGSGSRETTSDSTGNSTQYSWSIQAVLSIPIWDGGSRYGSMRSARAVVSQQKERVEATRRGATLESNQALRSIQVADQRRLLAEKNRDLAKQNANLTQKAFESGASTSFELVEAARRLREAELDLAVREFDLVKAKITALLANANCAY
jgi:outer membrane protein TolC